MSEHAATPTGAAEGEEPSRPILKSSRAEAIEAIQRKRVDDFNKEQKQAGSEELIEHSPELGRAKAADAEDAEDVDEDDRAAEAERARLEREAKDAEARERKAQGKTELDRQLEQDERVTVIDDPAKYRVKGKVDGEDVEFSLTDAVRAAQKEKAADRRLEQAATAMKEAERVRAEADARLKAAEDEVAKANAARDAQALKDAEAAREKARANLATSIKNYNDLLYDGKTEEASKVLLDLLQPVYERPTAPTPPPAAVDEEAITKKATANAVKVIKTESALDAFAKDYPEIIANKRLSEMADEFFDAAVKDGKSVTEALKFAGDTVRDEVREAAKSLGMSDVKPKTTTDRESRKERKEQIDEVDSASAARSLTDSQPEPASARSVIAEMARTRPGAAAAAAAEKARSGG